MQIKGQPRVPEVVERLRTDGHRVDLLNSTSAAIQHIPGAQARQ